MTRRPPIPSPRVRSRCKTCEKVFPENPWVFLGIVSRNGIEHIGMDDGYTACGRKAVSDRWWWPV